MTMTNDERLELEAERKRLQVMADKRERVGGYSESVVEIRAKIALIDEQLNAE